MEWWKTTDIVNSFANAVNSQAEKAIGAYTNKYQELMAQKAETERLRNWQQQQFFKNRLRAQRTANAEDRLRRANENLLELGFTDQIPITSNTINREMSEGFASSIVQEALTGASQAREKELRKAAEHDAKLGIPNWNKLTYEEQQDLIEQNYQVKFKALYPAGRYSLSDPGSFPYQSTRDKFFPELTGQEEWATILAGGGETIQQGGGVVPSVAQNITPSTALNITPMPEYIPESKLKDVRDAFLAGGMHLIQNAEMGLLTHPPSMPSEELPYPVGTHTTAIPPEMQYGTALDQYQGALQHTVDAYIRRREKHQDFWQEHPELTPRPEWLESPFQNTSLFKDAGWWGYVIASSAAYSLAVMGTMIVGSVVGTPALGIPLGIMAAALPETGDMLNELVDRGVPIEQARKPAELFGLFAGTVETVSDIPFLGLVFKPLQAATKPLWNVLGRVTANRLAKAALTGVALSQIEGLEEVVTQVMHNAILRNYDETQSILQGVPEAWIQGTIASLPFVAIGGGASYRTFHNNIESSVRQQYDSEVKRFVKAGLTEEQAQIKAANEIAKTPEGQVALSKAIEVAQAEYLEQHPAVKKQLEKKVTPQAVKPTAIARTPERQRLMLLNERQNVTSQIEKIQARLKETTDLSERQRIIDELIPLVQQRTRLHPNAANLGYTTELTGEGVFITESVFDMGKGEVAERTYRMTDEEATEFRRLDNLPNKERLPAQERFIENILEREGLFGRGKVVPITPEVTKSTATKAAPIKNYKDLKRVIGTGKTWAVISAEKSGLSEEVNTQRTQALSDILEREGYEFAPTEGVYQGEISTEQGYLVQDISEFKARQLGNLYEQDSVLVPRGFLFKEGNYTPVDLSKAIYGQKLPEGYTVVHAKRGDLIFALPEPNWETKLPIPREEVIASREGFTFQLGQEFPVESLTLESDLPILDSNYHSEQDHGIITVGTKDLGDYVTNPSEQEALIRMVALHEVGHHFSPLGKSKDSLTREINAWKWAISQASQYGITNAREVIAPLLAKAHPELGQGAISSQLGISETTALAEGTISGEIPEGTVEVTGLEPIQAIRKLQLRFTTRKIKYDAAKKQLVDYVNKHLPLEARGKMLASVKNVKTETGLRQAMAKADAYAEQAARKTLKTQIASQLKRISPKHQYGRFTAEIQGRLDAIKANAGMDRDEARAKIIENIQAAEEGKIPFEDAVKANEILQVSGLKGMSSAELAFALQDIKSLKATGRGLFAAQKEAEKARMLAPEEAINEATGGKGIKQGVGTIDTRSMNPRMSKPKEFITFWQFGMDDVLDWFGRLGKTKPYQGVFSQLGFKLHLSRSIQQKGVQTYHDERTGNALSEIYETKKGRLLNRLLGRMRHDKIDLGTFPDANGVKVNLVLTKSQIIQKYLELQDPTLDETFRDGMKWTDEIINAVRDSMTAEDIKFANWLTEFYQEYGQTIKPIFEAKYHIPFPENPYWVHLTREKEAGNYVHLLMAQNGYRIAGITSNSLKARTKNKIPLQFTDVFEIHMRHIVEMEHFKAFALSMKEARVIFGNKDVRTAIRQYHGEVALKHMDTHLDQIASDGRVGADLVSGIDRLRGHFTLAALGVKVAVSMKQALSLPAYITYQPMPIADFFSGVADFWTHPMQSIKEMKDLSGHLTERWGRGHERDIRLVKRKDVAGRLSSAKNWRDLFMLGIQTVDTSVTAAGAWAVYRSMRKQKMSKQDAITHAEIATDRSQPSFGIEDMAALRKTGSWGKLFTMFQSQPNKYYRLVANSIMNLKAGRGSKPRNITNILLAWWVLPMMFQLVSDAFQWKKEHQLRVAILGVGNYLLAAGQILQSAWGWITGEGFRAEVSPAFSTLRELEWSITGVVKLLEQGGDPLKEVDTDYLVSTIEHLAKAAGQIAGLPTPYAVQVERAIRNSDPRQLMFSQYALSNKDDVSRELQDMYAKAWGYASWDSLPEGNANTAGTRAHFNSLNS